MTRRSVHAAASAVGVGGGGGGGGGAVRGRPRAAGAAWGRGPARRRGRRKGGARRAVGGRGGVEAVGVPLEKQGEGGDDERRAGDARRAEAGVYLEVDVDGVPRDERGGRGAVSDTEALFNTTNMLLGVGLLGLPYAYSIGGFATTGVLLVLGLTTLMTGKWLAQCQRAGPGGLLRTYEDIGEHAFGLPGRWVVMLVLYTELIGTGSLFLILEADHLRLLGGDALSTLTASVQGLGPVLGLGRASESTVLLCLSALIMLPTMWTNDLRSLAKLGLLGSASAVFVVFAICYFGLQIFEVHAGGSLATTSLVDPGRLPLTAGIISFLFAGHAVFPAVHTSMRDRESFDRPGGVLDATYLIVMVSCLTVGMVGYYIFGSSAAEEVTMNLQRANATGAVHGVGDLWRRLVQAVSGLLGGADDPAALVSAVPHSAFVSTMTSVLVLVSPVTKCALTLEPVASQIEGLLDGGGETPPGSRLRRGAIRSSLLVLCLLLATALPSFIGFMNLVGSVLTMLVSFILPSLFYLKIYGVDRAPPPAALGDGGEGAAGLAPGELALGVAVILLGVGCAGIGVLHSVGLYE